MQDQDETNELYEIYKEHTTEGNTSAIGLSKMLSYLKGIDDPGMKKAIVDEFGELSGAAHG